MIVVPPDSVGAAEVLPDAIMDVVTSLDAMVTVGCATKFSLVKVMGSVVPVKV